MTIRVCLPRSEASMPFLLNVILKYLLFIYPVLLEDWENPGRLLFLSTIINCKWEFDLQVMFSLQYLQILKCFFKNYFFQKRVSSVRASVGLYRPLGETH